MPVRVRLERRRGWRKPAGAVVVARPSRFGNPFTISDARRLGAGTEAEARGRAIGAYRAWLAQGDEAWPVEDGAARRAAILRDLPLLAGKDLCCWCPLDQPCHADVLLDLANRPDSKGSR